MSVLQCCLIIIISAIGGWVIAVAFLSFFFKPYNTQKIIGFSLPGLLHSLQPVLSKNATEWISQKFIHTGVLETKLTDPLLMQQLRPEIEAHVDRFLAVKLPEAFPLLAKMMGDKTLAKFKEAFLTEAENIFPALIKSYGQKLWNQYSKVEIEQLINTISIPALKKYIYEQASVQILQFKMIGLVCGIFIGILQIVLIFLLA